MLTQDLVGKVDLVASLGELCVREIAVAVGIQNLVPGLLQAAVSKPLLGDVMQAFQEVLHHLEGARVVVQAHPCQVSLGTDLETPSLAPRAIGGHLGVEDLAHASTCIRARESDGDAINSPRILKLHHEGFACSMHRLGLPKAAWAVNLGRRVQGHFRRAAHNAEEHLLPEFLDDIDVLGDSMLHLVRIVAMRLVMPVFVIRRRITILVMGELLEAPIESSNSLLRPLRAVA
mmetsp:Transcript_13271/g.42812  ORF Transcript_13271/g.42812 Transcript_13271/m.42812 type:complete len:232 (-) Transcript_13271:158-853(-)